MSSDTVTWVAKGYAPIAGGVTGVALNYLDVINSLFSLVLVLFGIVGAYWLCRKNKAEANKVEIENESNRVENYERQIKLDDKEIEQRLEKTAANLLEKIAKHIRTEK